MQPSPSADTDARVLDALTLAAVQVDADLRIAHANPVAERFFGAEAGELVGRPVTEALFDAPERGAAVEVLDRVFSDKRWDGEITVVGPAGRHDALVSVSPLHAEGLIDGALLLGEDVGTSRGRARRLAGRLAKLGSITAELLGAADVETVTGIFVEHMADAAGATVASLSLCLSEDTLRLIGIRGGREGAASRFHTYPVAGTPAGDSVRSGQPVVLIGRDAIWSRYPDLESAAEGERSMVCLPLTVTGRIIGVASLSFPGKRAFDGPEMEFFRVMADACAQALDRVRALADAADRASKLRFLAQATDELASSLDYEMTLRNVARLAVPWFADWCSIALGIDGELRTLEVAHVDPDKVALALEFNRRYPPDPDAPSGSYQVFRTGRSELVPEITEEMILQAIQDEEQLAMVRDLNLWSAMSVPLAAHDRVLGVITWVAGEHGRRFGPQDLTFAEDLARRAAVAIDNAQLHTEVQQMAGRLQHAVLPESLPRLAGWDMAAHYLPSGHLDAGGDFYDVVRLDHDRLAFFVGDVTGHGVHAAAAMAQMRSSIRAFAAVDPEPHVVLTRLDRLFEQYEIDQLVTMIYGVVDPVRDELTLANAGHPSPLLLRADGSLEWLDEPSDVLLGVGGSDRPTVTVPFSPGDSLLGFTDGLIERRAEHLDDGMARLLGACRVLASGPIDAAVVALIEEVRDPTRDDDVAALLLRRLT